MKTEDKENNKLLGIELPTDSPETILEKTIKYIRKPSGNFVIMSLNPEIFVEMQQNPAFKKVVTKAQIKIIDGVGVVLAGRMRGIPVGPRFTGVDMMDRLVQVASREGLSVMLIGGSEKVAERLADCYSIKYPRLDIVGLRGIKNIAKPAQAEIDELFSIVADRKPHIIFFAFGSPMQELFVETHAERLTGIVCAGVGGAFDFLLGEKKRAPRVLRQLGLEWAFRLIQEPWRWRRQLRLLTFLWYSTREAFQGNGSR